jgi:hypothetical protein
MHSAWIPMSVSTGLWLSSGGVPGKYLKQRTTPSDCLSLFTLHIKLLVSLTSQCHCITDAQCVQRSFVCRRGAIGHQQNGVWWRYTDRVSWLHTQSLRGKWCSVPTADRTLSHSVASGAVCRQQFAASSSTVALRLPIPSPPRYLPGP